MDSDKDERVVEPRPAIRGTLRVPGDKSISHRVAMLTGLAQGESTIDGFLDSEDCLNTLGAVQALGAGVKRNGTQVQVTGTGGAFRCPAGVLDMGNSGTGMRLLAGLLAGQSFRSEMTGDVSLCSRPMRRIKEPLERMGARIELMGKNDCAPIRIGGGTLRGIEYRPPVASAQVKSCVLLAGLFAEGRTTVVESMATRDHTERLLADAGIAVACDGLQVSLEGCGAAGPSIRARHWQVPCDFSSAAFWLTAAACRPGASVTVEGVGMNPRRTALLNVLRRMGADIEVRHSPTASLSDAGEPMGTVTARGRGLKGTDVGGDEIPNLIDELPLVAVAGALAEGVTVIRDADELRVKESDRIATMAKNLAALGVRVEEQLDGMRVTGRSRIRGGVETDSVGDHRVAMAMAILALFAEAPIRIRHVACVATSYPGFWDDLSKVTGDS